MCEVTTPSTVRDAMHERTRSAHAAARSVAYLRCHNGTFAEGAIMNTVQFIDPIKQRRGRDLMADSMETLDRLGASLAIQHRTIKDRTINGEQVATSNAGQVLFMEDDLSTRQGNTVSLTHREFVLLIAATMSE
jgi:hypothetical protein